MEKSSLQVCLGNALKLKNPIIAASGTYGYGSEYIDVCPPRDWGAVVLKSVSLQPREGNPPPRCCETASGMLNSIGLANVGAREFLWDKMIALQDESARGAVVIANLAGETIEEFIELSEEISEYGQVKAIEINISCPNVEKGGMQFGSNAKLAAEVVKACQRHSSTPVWVKLSPNVTDPVEIAQTVADAGADVLVVANTLMGMRIDISTRRPKLGNIFGGLSGPAILPVNLRIAWQIAKALPQMPIVGCGGIVDGEGALEYIMAGCSAVEVGTATFRNPRSLYKILDEMKDYMQENDIECVGDLVGVAQQTT